MSDKREEILNRLLEIAALVEGVTAAERNNLNLNEKKLPAIVIMEGDEEPSLSVDERRHYPTLRPIPMVMVPEVCILGADDASEIGTTLNTLRVRFIKAAMSDATLATILGSNGAVAYRGLMSDMGLGRTNIGRMALRLAITYMLSPSKL